MKYSFLPLMALLASGIVGLLALSACDAGLSGERLDNEPPRTYLAVRDTSLVENICRQTPSGFVCTDDDNLFTSTVFVAWTGVDPDGFVVGYELRYYDSSERPGVDDLWTHTTSRDTLILLPLPFGQSTAQVVFEVRAIDNQGLKDPNPARTVFPIGNSDPTIRLIAFETPPDTTWDIISFGFNASDPDGPQDLLAIEFSLNDEENFVSIPPNVQFITLVAETVPPGTPTTSARVFFGRGFSSTSVTVDGLRLDADNTLFIRAMDRSGATSNLISYPNRDLDQRWFVRQPKNDVLLVNDFRAGRSDEVLPFHRAALRGYLGSASFDVWDLSQPMASNLYSTALPPVAVPTLRETFKRWRYIYWVSNNVTASVIGNNLAFSASFLEDFLATGGKIFVQVPFTAPPAGEVDFNNPAYDLLPAESIVVRPGTSVPPSLAIPNNGRVQAAQPVPGTGRMLPELRAQRLAFTLPYTINPSTTVPLYQGEFIDRDANNAPWTGSSVVATMDVERRVGLLALQLYTRNRYDFAGPGADGQAPCLAVQYILEGLSFPGTPGNCPAPSFR
ncbi:hypothetical protein BH23BAC4_BH23BAC4_00400 [soil metagenome]